MEDDAKIGAHTPTVMKAILVQLRSTGYAWDIIRFGRSTADPRGMVLPRDEQADVVAEFRCKQGKGTVTASLITEVGSWTGAYALSPRALRLLTECGFGDCLINVDDFLYCCSHGSKHPRTDLYDVPAVRYITERGGLVPVTVPFSVQKDVLSITMCDAADISDC